MFKICINCRHILYPTSFDPEFEYCEDCRRRCDRIRFIKKIQTEVEEMSDINKYKCFCQRKEKEMENKIELGSYVRIIKDSDHGLSELFVDSIYVVTLVLSDSVFMESYDLGYKVELFAFKENLEVIEHGIEV